MGSEAQYNDRDVKKDQSSPDQVIERERRRDDCLRFHGVSMLFI
jgi:hypothetical protein